MHACMYVCTYVCMYVCIGVCIYIYIYIYTYYNNISYYGNILTPTVCAPLHRPPSARCRWTPWAPGRRWGWRPRNTPDLPTNIVPTNIAWLKLSGKFPVDMRIPPLNIQIMLESNPPKPTMLVGRLGVDMFIESGSRNPGSSVSHWGDLILPWAADCIWPVCEKNEQRKQPTTYIHR